MVGISGQNESRVKKNNVPLRDFSSMFVGRLLLEARFLGEFRLKNQHFWRPNWGIGFY